MVLGYIWTPKDTIPDGSYPVFDSIDSLEDALIWTFYESSVPPYSVYFVEAELDRMGFSTSFRIINFVGDF